MTYTLDSFAYTLARLRWDIFGTLTFRSVPPRGIAWGQAWALMRHAAEIVGQPYKRLLIALRCERGEIGGRVHFHFLMGGTETRNATTLSFQLRHEWRQHLRSSSHIRPYDHALAGVAYVTKCLSTTGADDYEMRKFAPAAVEVTCSRSIFRVVRKLERMGSEGRSASTA